MSQQNLEEILKALQAQNELLLQVVREATSPRERASSRVSEFHLTPPLKPTSSPTVGYEFQPLSRQTRRLTLEAQQKHVPSSVHSSHSDHHEDDMIFSPLPLLELCTSNGSNPRQRQEPTKAVKRALEPVHFDDGQLLDYLIRTEFTGGAAIALQEFLKKRDGQGIGWAQSLEYLAQYERNDEASYWNPTFDVYDIGADCVAQKVPRRPREGYEAVDDVDAPTAWEMIKDINYPSGQSVGRITIVQEPTALILGSLHFAMGQYFDMNEIYSHLVTPEGNDGKTTAYMSRAFLPDQASSMSTVMAMPPSANDANPNPNSPLHPDPLIRHRTFFFVFKYYAVVAPGHTSAPWERFDRRPPDRRSQDHIDIAECNSILALSLSGKPLQSSTRRQRRGKPPRVGHLFDTFAPWHLLNIQSFPDDEHTDRGEGEGQEVVNGPFAFLDALLVEYRDAVTRNEILHERITKLATPDINFMFEAKIRDKLLFEDKHFTYIRRYFWAYMSLRVINTSIRSMLSAYTTTFTRPFWDGRHSTLWPHPEPDSAAGLEYRAKLAPLRRELEAVLGELSAVYEKNEKTRKEIQSLREQLFSGSSIMESRRAIEQGDNIRILTLSSMIFLPLTFVTSVFGITEFTIAATDWRFAVTMVCVCVPFVILLILLQTRFVNNAIRSARAKLKDKTIELWTTLVRRENEDANSATAAAAAGEASRHAGRRRFIPPMPVGPPSDEEKRDLLDWLLCGVRGRGRVKEAMEMAKVEGMEGVRVV